MTKLEGNFRSPYYKSPISSQRISAAQSVATSLRYAKTKMFAKVQAVTSYKLISKFNRLALTNVYTHVMASICMVVSMAFSGHMGDERIQAAVGIGNSISFIFIMSCCEGAGRGLDTLHTIAYGAGDLHLCGVYLNRGRFLVTLVFIPVALLLYSLSEQLAGIFTDDEIVIANTRLYL
jgi:Na+-driven multidrug efflux pump